MADVIEIPVEIRETQGKGASRRLRRENLVPGIVYGGNREPQAIQLSQYFLSKALEDESFYTSILSIKAGEKAQRVILRDLQRHPVKPIIMHIDFQRISDDEAIRMSVPIHFVNEASSPAGKKSGVVISHQLNELEISALPGDLPEFIEIDLVEMDVGDNFYLRDVKMPEGVTLTAQEEELDRAVASAVEVKSQRAAEEAEGEGPEPGEVPTAGDEE
ncbi:MAG: 50S ribosomal protein L25/general stress protein Ctc [Pseudomonadota bacterium]